ncbi:MAG: TonB-dependent receptor [Bacteroidetes bacterium]|nr:TonB-dependent receptor [Bacteroidota bacterium]
MLQLLKYIKQINSKMQLIRISKLFSIKIVTILFICTIQLNAGVTGKIVGKITSEKTGEALVSAIVRVEGTSLGAVTDIEGNFIILNLPPNTYALTINLIGYHQIKIINVKISADFTTIQNIKLKEESVEMGEVVIQSQRPLIKQDQTNPVVSISAEDFEALPVNSVSEVIGLQAGIVVDDGGGIHVRGGRSNEISFALNGVSLNNPYNNQSNIDVATNALQEVSISTGTFSAEYGNALSGVVNYVTKEGSEKYSGSFRTLNGDYVSSKKDIYPHIDKVDPFNKQRYEVTFGGPLFIDGLKFYTSAVHRRENGWLYGDRIYNPKDFYVYASDLNWQEIKYDANGTPLRDAGGNYIYYSDPRLGNLNGPFYFDPISNDTSKLNSLPSGDNSLVPLNWFTSLNWQANISYNLSSTSKLKYEIITDQGESQDAFYYSYRFNPNGRPTNYSKSIIQSLDFTQTLTNEIFYTLKASYIDASDKTYFRKDIDHPDYLPGFYQTSLPSTSFLTGGTYNGRTFVNSSTLGFKFDLVAQTGINEIKTGIEFRKHKLKLESYTLQFIDKSNPEKIITNFHDIYNDSIKYIARIPDVASGYTSYTREPIQISAYLQDKIELWQSLILNGGVRVEYEDPAAKHNPNLSDALSNRDTLFLIKDLTDTKPKINISPRLSIAYPITDQGVIRFSYGHFYQFGNLSSVYTNPNFRAPDGVRPIFGNANVKPQRSVQYEIGLQQGLTPDLRLEVVGFQKDVRDYIFRQIVITSKGDISYEVLTNLDYANTRGLTISLYQRRVAGSNFNSTVDYTFSVAEGNRTEPREDFFYSEKSGKSAETFLVPLSFDRSHILNTTFSFTEPNDYSASVIFRLQSGSPYTPSIPASLSLQQTTFVQNSALKPFQYSTDLKIEKTLKFTGNTLKISAQIDNLFDIQNELDVYSNSGRALYNADVIANPTQFNQITSRINKGHNGLIPMEAITNYFIDPINVSRPRLVRIGFMYYF